MADLDTSNFDLGVDMLTTTGRKAAEFGMARAGMRLANHVIMQPPTCPIDKGTLRGSLSVVMNKKVVTTGAQLGHDGPDSTPATELPEKPERHEVVVAVGCNTPYAKAVHEGLEMEFKNSDSDAKFIESKLTSNGPEYMQTAADGIKKYLNEHSTQGHF